MPSPLEQIWDTLVNEIKSLGLFEVEKRRVALKTQDKQNIPVITVCYDGQDANAISFNVQEVIYSYRVTVMDPTLGRNTLIQTAEVRAYEHRREIWEHFRGLTSLSSVSTVFDINVEDPALDKGIVSQAHHDRPELIIKVHNWEERATF